MKPDVPKLVSFTGHVTYYVIAGGAKGVCSAHVHHAVIHSMQHPHIVTTVDLKRRSIRFLISYRKTTFLFQNIYTDVWQLQRTLLTSGCFPLEVHSFCFSSVTFQSTWWVEINQYRLYRCAVLKQAERILLCCCQEIKERKSNRHLRLGNGDIIYVKGVDGLSRPQHQQTQILHNQHCGVIPNTVLFKCDHMVI